MPRACIAIPPARPAKAIAKRRVAVLPCRLHHILPPLDASPGLSLHHSAQTLIDQFAYLWLGLSKGKEAAWSEGSTTPKGIIPAQRGSVRRAKKTIRGWKQAKLLLERWRRELVNINFELKRPRVIDVVPIDFVSGEPVEREGSPTNRFRGQVVYFKNADVTVRRPPGAIPVIDSYEIAAMSDGKKRFEPL